MAKFKAGDYVEVIYGSDRGRKGTVELSREYRGDILYKIRFADGPEPLVRDGFVEHNLKKLNAANAVVQKAMNADEWEKVYQIKGLPVKFVYRGSPYNDIKATIEGGNRDYIPVGRIIASAPISQVEAEKLASAKWRQIKKTARNANAARNAVVQNALNAATKTYDPNRRPSVLVGEINRKCPRLSAEVDAWFVRVEFRDKKGVKGRLPDAIMAEPGFPRDKLEVADVRADAVLFTVKGNPYVNAVNAKFAVTTKSGRSVVIEAPNYKAAEKEAKRRFGAGCIVYLIANSRVRNAAGYVDASSVVLQPGDAVVFKAGYRLHSNDDDWLERNGDTVREVRGDEVKLGPSANDWAKIKDLMVWHNSRSTNAVVVKALNASRVPLDAEKAINAVGRDKQDAASVEMWAGAAWNNFLTFALPKFTDKERARKNGEKIIKYVEDALGSEGGKAQLKKMGLTIQKMRDALENGLDTVAARNATTKRVARNAIEKFEVGKIYRAPWDREWLAKVLSRTASSIKVAIKSVRDKTWHSSDEQVTLRINPRKSEELGAEVAAGWDWEFWADNKA